MSEEKGARSTRRRAGFDDMFPRRTIRRPPWSVVESAWWADGE